MDHGGGQNIIVVCDVTSKKPSIKSSFTHENPQCTGPETKMVERCLRVGYDQYQTSICRRV